MILTCKSFIHFYLLFSSPLSVHGKLYPSLYSYFSVSLYPRFVEVLKYIWSCAGCHSTEQDQVCEPKPKCSKANTEVHRNCHGGQLRFLVYGGLKISENFQISWAGSFSSLAGLQNPPFKLEDSCCQDKHKDTKDDQKQTKIWRLSWRCWASSLIKGISLHCIYPSYWTQHLTCDNSEWMWFISVELQTWLSSYLVVNERVHCLEIICCRIQTICALFGPEWFLRKGWAYVRTLWREINVEGKLLASFSNVQVWGSITRWFII